MNLTITTAINQMSLPEAQVHLYFPIDKEQEARTHAFRTGKPVFRSVKNGVTFWSVKVR